MNFKRLGLAVAAVFGAIWVTDFLIHGVWLRPDYQASAGLWRTEAEMLRHLGWMLAGQFLAAVAFTTLWARGFAPTACWRCAVMYGLFMALFREAVGLVFYSVQPIPGELSVKWFCAGLAQGMVLGVVAFLVYRPAATAPGGSQ